jgi:hypothetical protein
VVKRQGPAIDSVGVACYIRHMIIASARLVWLLALSGSLASPLAFVGIPSVLTVGDQRGIPGNVVGDYIAPPPNLARYFEVVPIIVDAEVIRTGHPKLIDRAVIRTHELRALEVFKGGVNLGTIFKVVQPGGIVEDEGGKIHRAGYDMPLLEVGQRVVLFLEPQAGSTDTYAVSFGPNGMFVRSAKEPEKLVVPPGARGIPQFAGRADGWVDALLVELRRLRDRR